MARLMRLQLQGFPMLRIPCLSKMDTEYALKPRRPECVSCCGPRVTKPAQLTVMPFPLLLGGTLIE
jgi:hypothetical protein